MNANVEAQSAPVESAERTQPLPWALCARQVGAILRLELKKNFFNRRAFILYLLALLPIALLTLFALFPPQGREFDDPNTLSVIFAAIYEGLILRTILFFGCAWVFMNLFRGEVVDRSLHYYFLCPVRRDILVVGKYLSGLVTTVLLFAGTTLVSNLLLHSPRGFAAANQYFFGGVGLSHLLTYLSITTLACVGYGAFFLAAGLLVRNPIIPALLLYGWEWINFLLPPVLKKISVIHYLQSLTPVLMSEGPFALVSEPTPAWISVPSLLLVTISVLVFASWRIKRMEIRYGGD